MKSFGSLRYSLFSKKQTTPALKKLSPTDNSPKEHVKRARLQVLNTFCVNRARYYSAHFLLCDILHKIILNGKHLIHVRHIVKYIYYS